MSDATPPPRQSGRAIGCLGAFLGFAFATVLILPPLFGAAKHMVTWQAAFLAAGFALLVYLRRRASDRTLLFGALIGFGVCGLIWGICAVSLGN